MGVIEDWQKTALDADTEAVSQKIGEAADAAGQATVFGRLNKVIQDTDTVEVTYQIGDKWKKANTSEYGYALTCAENRWIVASDRNKKIIYSDDFGQHWITANITLTATIYKLIYIEEHNLIVGVGTGSGGANVILSTDKGVTWTTKTTTDSENAWCGLVYGNGIIVASAQNGTYPVMYSTDLGQSWVRCTKTFGSMVTGLVYLETTKKFYIGIATTGANFFESTNGNGWTQITSANDIAISDGQINGLIADKMSLSIGIIRNDKTMLVYYLAPFEILSKKYDLPEVMGLDTRGDKCGSYFYVFGSTNKPVLYRYGVNLTEYETILLPFRSFVFGTASDKSGRIMLISNGGVYMSDKYIENRSADDLTALAAHGYRSRRFYGTQNGSQVIRWTIPPGITRVYVEACAAGNDGTVATGGNGGACFEGEIEVEPGAKLTLNFRDGNISIGNGYDGGIISLSKGGGAKPDEASIFANAGSNNGASSGGGGGYGGGGAAGNSNLGYLQPSYGKGGFGGVGFQRVAGGNDNAISGSAPGGNGSWGAGGGKGGTASNAGKGGNSIVVIYY